MRHVIERVLRRWRRAPADRAQRRHALVGPPDLWEAKRTFQVKFLKDAGLEPSHHLLDIGCGTLRGGIPIIAYLARGHYFGIESRRAVLAEGWRELREAGLTAKQPTLIHVDELYRHRLDHMFEYVWAFSVLIHMDDRVLHDTLRLVRSCLKTSGRFFANVNIGERPDGEWQGFPVVWRSLAFYIRACADCGLQLEDIGPSSAFGNVSPGGSPSPDTQRMLKVWAA